MLHQAGLRVFIGAMALTLLNHSGLTIRLFPVPRETGETQAAASIATLDIISIRLYYRVNGCITGWTADRTLAKCYRFRRCCGWTRRWARPGAAPRDLRLGRAAVPRGGGPGSAQVQPHLFTLKLLSEPFKERIQICFSYSIDHVRMVEQVSLQPH